MKTMWKNVLGIVLVAAVSAGVTIGTNAYLMERNGQPVKLAGGVTNTFKQPFQLTGFNTVAAENIDFTTAAENSVHGVVHIKATANVKAQDMGSNQQIVDPFELFFGFGGRGFQRPQPQPRVGTGSGVIISTDGYIITNNHVIDGADDLEVTLNDNRKFSAKVIGTDPVTDVALIKIDAKDLPVIPFGDSEKLKVGEWVLAIGNPFNLNSTVTAGIVSAKGRGGITSGRGDLSKIESFIQTDAAVNPGNSGGALVNTKGELVGINTAIYTRTGDFSGYSFAIPISIASKIANDLKQYGAVQRARLGVSILSVPEISERLQYPNLSPDYKKELEELKSKIKVSEGACVADVEDRSPAKEAGIEKGDVITAINGAKVRTANGLQEQISKYRPGDKVQVTVDRNGTTKTFNVELRNAQGSTAIVKGNADATEVLGAAFKSLSDQQKREYGVSSGIEVVGLMNGKMKDAGIKKGFIILSANDRRISTPEQLEDLASKVLKASSEDSYLLVKGFYPNEKRTRIYAIDLAE